MRLVVASSVLAELRVRALAVRVGPGAARTIEALLLIEQHQRASAAHSAHLAPSELHRVEDGGHAARNSARRLQFKAGEIFRRLRARLDARLFITRAVCGRGFRAKLRLAPQVILAGLVMAGMLGVGERFSLALLSRPLVQFLFLSLQLTHCGFQ
jgi:hypothetical protein